MLHFTSRMIKTASYGLTVYEARLRSVGRSVSIAAARGAAACSPQAGGMQLGCAMPLMSTAPEGGAAACNRYGRVRRRSRRCSGMQSACSWALHTTTEKATKFNTFFGRILRTDMRLESQPTVGTSAQIGSKKLLDPPTIPKQKSTKSS